MKIGILSFAHHHGESYIHHLRNLPGVELIGVADDETARGQQMAEQHNTRFFPTYEALLESKPDGVIVCSENNRHRPLVELAAQAGVHVMSEKPLATSVADGVAMIEACRRAGVLLMTAFPMRFSVPLMSVKQRLDAGEFGRVLAFNSANQGELPTKYRQWFVDPVKAGGGAMIDHTVHLVDIMRWYLRDEVSEVYAQANRIFHADEVEVETGGLELITFRSGTFASIDTSWSRPDFWPTWGGLWFEMVTERGSLLVDAFRQQLAVYSGQTQRPQWSYWGSDANRAMVIEFVAAIREGREPSVTGLDGLRATEVALAAYQSVETGQPVRLEPAAVVGA